MEYCNCTRHLGITWCLHVCLRREEGEEGRRKQMSHRHSVLMESCPVDRTLGVIRRRTTRKQASRCFPNFKRTPQHCLQRIRSDSNLTKTKAKEGRRQDKAKWSPRLKASTFIAAMDEEHLAVKPSKESWGKSIVLFLFSDSSNCSPTLFTYRDSRIKAADERTLAEIRGEINRNSRINEVNERALHRRGEGSSQYKERAQLFDEYRR